MWKKLGSFPGICTVNTFLVIHHCRYKMDDNKVVNYPSKFLKVMLSSFSNPTVFYISQIATRTGHTRLAKKEWMQITADSIWQGIVTKECNRRVCEGSLMITQQWFSQNIWLASNREGIKFSGWWKFRFIQSDTKKRELMKNPTKIEEIQEKKKLLTEIEPLLLAF